MHQFLSTQEFEITESDAETIVKNTTGGVWSCVDVCKAFCHRAAVAHQLVCTADPKTEIEGEMRQTERLS